MSECSFHVGCKGGGECEYEMWHILKRKSLFVLGIESPLGLYHAHNSGRVSILTGVLAVVRLQYVTFREVTLSMTTNPY